MIGTITQLDTVEERVLAQGTIDLKVVGLVNTPVADELQAGRPVGVALDIDTPTTLAGRRDTAGVLIDPTDPYAWQIRGAHLNSRPAWPAAQIALTTAPGPSPSSTIFPTTGGGAGRP